MTLTEARESLQAGVAAKHTQTCLAYTFTRNGLRYSISQPLIDGDLAATHQWLRRHVIDQYLPKTGYWHCVERAR